MKDSETRGIFANPNLGEYWGDPLVGYFLCRGVEGGWGPTIISILAKINEKKKKTPAKRIMKQHVGEKKSVGKLQRRKEQLKRQGERGES